MTESVNSVYVPLPKLIETSNLFLVTKLIEARVVSLVRGSKFPEDLGSLITEYTDHPPNFRTQNEIDSWIMHSTLDLRADFNLIEQQQTYQDAMQSLKQHQGWNIINIKPTLSGINVILTNSKEI